VARGNCAGGRGQTEREPENEEHGEGPKSFHGSLLKAGGLVMLIPMRAARCRAVGVRASRHAAWRRMPRNRPTTFEYVGRTRMLAPFLLLALPATAAQSGDPDLIPWPRSVRLDAGDLQLRAGSRISAAGGALAPLADVLSREVLLAAGLNLPATRDQATAGDIELRL